MRKLFALAGTMAAAFLLPLLVQAQSGTTPQPAPPQPICQGCGHDAHGCYTSAGYFWCEAKQKCLRSWEEACTGTGSTSARPSIPPASYEDEVLTTFDAYKNPFPDTDMNDVSGKAAAELYRRAVIGGFPDGQFKGDRPVNRAEAAKFLVLARFQSEQSGPNAVVNFTNDGRFPDVLEGQWYTKYVIAAAKKNIIKGNPDGTFRPANTVNTAEFLKMLALTFGLTLNQDYPYMDVKPTDWFAPYAGLAYRYNLFPDRKIALLPGKALTRKEVAVAIYQYLSQR